MARTPAPEVNITEAIQPVATVHDTYWRPAQPEPSPLHQVARSLASLSDDLSSTFSRMDAEAAHGAKEAGETAFWTGQAPGNTNLPGAEGVPAPSSAAIAEGHRQGVLPIWGSKAAKQYEDGYQSAAGLAEGAAMQGRILEKYTALDESVKLSMTPEQFDQWVHGQIRTDPSATVANTNKGFAKGIAPQYREVYSKLTDKWNQDRTKDAQIKAERAWGSALTATLEQSSIEGKGREGGTDYAQATANVQAIRDAGFKAGMRQDEIDKQVAASVIQQATLDRDPNMLTILDSLKGPGGRPLSQSPETTAAKNAAMTSIAQLREQDRQRAIALQDREDKLAHDGSLRTITQGMMKDPNYTPDPKDVANVYRRDPTAEATILKTRQSIADGKAFEDPEKVRSLMADIYANPGQGWDILRRGMGDIHTAATLKQAREAVIQMETYQQQDSKLFETPSWKRLESFILDAGKPPNMSGSAFREPAQTPATAQALLDAKMAALQWLNTPEGKAANQLQREKFVAGLQKEMFQALKEQGDMGAIYTRTEGITKAMEAAPASEAPTQPGAPQNAPAGSPAAPAGQTPSFMREGTNSTAPAPAIKPWIQELANSPDAPPKWENMKIGAEYRKDVEDMARKVGKDPQWVIDQAWQRLKGNIDAARRGTGQPAPQQAAPPQQQAPVPYTQGGPIAGPLGALDLSAGGVSNAVTQAARSLVERMGSVPNGPINIPGLGTLHFTPEGATAEGVQRQAPSPAPAAPEQRSEAFPVQRASFTGDASTTLAMAATQEGLDLGARFRTLAADPAGDTITAQNGGPVVGSGLQQVSQRRVAQINATPSGAIIDRVARAQGFDPDVAKAIASIESSGRPNVVTGSYKGLFQLSNAEFEKFGPKDGRDIMDPEANTIAGINSIKHKMAVFAKEFGRQPSPTELYLMHQQGEAGLRSHAGNPNGLAWENMLNTGEGRRKGERWAKLAVWGNVPSDMRAQFGSVDNMTSAQFIAVWITKLQGVPYQQALALVQSGSRMAAKPKDQRDI
jgi:hypothetical protein